MLSLRLFVHRGQRHNGQRHRLSSVRSSYSHPDLLVIHHPTHFFRSHRSSTLDFHFLSHYSYIKAIKLYKGNQWTHLLAKCIPYGYNKTSLQDSARECKIVQDFFLTCRDKRKSCLIVLQQNNVEVR